MAFLWFGVMLCLQTGTFTGFYILLAICTCLLGAAAWWFVSSFHLPRPVLLAMGAGIALLAATWAWQRVVFVMLLPAGPLVYGYFLTPAGRSAGFLVLKAPMIVVACACVLLALVSTTAAWRGGARWSILALLSWWLALYVTFMLPSAYLDAQGNASVFI